jgi:uncharacterized protein (DUF1697 family)
MPTWIALLRGINVGGRNKLSMTVLKSVFEATGCSSVRTYIQSGNVVFQHQATSAEDLSERLATAIEGQIGFRPVILLLDETEFRTAVSNNPFVDAVSAPQTLHFFFLDSAPTAPDLDAIAALATSTERYHLIGNVFYLHAPDGIGRSKLAASAERKLRTPATARNYNTVLALAEMLGAE